MTYVITQPCCNDAACVPACPVNCIHPTPDEPDFGTAEQLYIDPEACIECGACVDVCPVGAIHPDYELPARSERFTDLNALYYEDPSHRLYSPTPARETRTKVETAPDSTLHIAVVGSGPAACYFVEESLATFGASVRINLFERLPVIGGLVRHGVAPDHQATKSVGDRFAASLRAKNVQLFLNCEVGSTISHEDLLAHHHAVVYATGASQAQLMGIPGEALPGSFDAHTFVSWYNGHPDYADLQVDLSHERALIVGNGNVALDVARILTAPVDQLRRTDISDRALEQLEASDIHEVVISGRRGPDQAAFTAGELIGLAAGPSVGLVCEPEDLAVGLAERTQGVAHSQAQSYKRQMLADLSGTTERERQIRFRFGLIVTHLRGVEAVERAAISRQDAVRADGVVTWQTTGHTEELRCGLVVSCIGYRRSPELEIVVDAEPGWATFEAGRTVDSGGDLAGPPVSGRYAVGWAKRGPSGGVGINRRCAQETLRSIVADLEAGLLSPPVHDEASLRLAMGNGPVIDRDGWSTIDAAERAAGREQGRPRVKFTSMEHILGRIGEGASTTVDVTGAGAGR